MVNESRDSFGSGDHLSPTIGKYFTRNILTLIVKSYGLWRNEGYKRNGDDEKDFNIRIYDFMCEIVRKKGLNIFVHWEHPAPTDAMKKGRADSGHSVRIDIAVYGWRGVSRDPFLMIECKRLDLSDLCRRYVKNGILRFVDGRYGSDVGYGVMVGYVLGGSLGHVVHRVNSYIESLLGSEHRMNDTEAVEELESVYLSLHSRKEPLPTIALTHLFFCMQDLPEFQLSKP